MKVQVWYFLYVGIFCSAFAVDESDYYTLTLSCPDDYLIQGIASRSPFFQDAVKSSCFRAAPGTCPDESQTYEFEPSSGGGYSLEAGCPIESQIIKTVTFRLRDGRVFSSSLECCTLNEPSEALEHEQVSSDSSQHTFVSCSQEAAMRKIVLSDAGDDVTRIQLECVKLTSDEENS